MSEIKDHWEKKVKKNPTQSALRQQQCWTIIHVDYCGPLTVKYHHEVTREVIKQKIKLLTI